MKKKMYVNIRIESLSAGVQNRTTAECGNKTHSSHADRDAGRESLPARRAAENVRGLCFLRVPSVLHKQHGLHVEDFCFSIVPDCIKKPFSPLLLSAYLFLTTRQTKREQRHTFRCGLLFKLRPGRERVSMQSPEKRKSLMSLSFRLPNDHARSITD